MPLLYQNAYGGLDNRVPIPAHLKDDYMRTVALGCSSITRAFIRAILWARAIS